MSHVYRCDEPSTLPIGAYLLVVSYADDHDEYDYQVVADGYQQAAERAAEWCGSDGARYRGTLHVITGDDSSRRIATIDGADWWLS